MNAGQGHRQGQELLLRTRLGHTLTAVQDFLAGRPRWSPVLTPPGRGPAPPPRQPLTGVARGPFEKATLKGGTAAGGDSPRDPGHNHHQGSCPVGEGHAHRWGLYSDTYGRRKARRAWRPLPGGRARGVWGWPAQKALIPRGAGGPPSGLGNSQFRASLRLRPWTQTRGILGSVVLWELRGLSKMGGQPRKRREKGGYPDPDPRVGF